MKLPNVLFILIDDLGFGDVGFTQGSPPSATFTPNIDQLANDGLILDRHLAYKTCTPSRSALQSGRLPVHVTEQLKVPDNPNAAIPYNMTTISELLAEDGVYNCHIVGKWDAGMATYRHTPKGRGFSDESLTYFSHKNDFFTHNTLQSGCQTTCETENPGSHDCIIDMWEGSGPAVEVEKERAGDFVEDVFLDRALDILNEEEQTDNPFLMFYSSHIAHCPLQVPQDRLEPFLNLPNDESLCSAQTDIVNPVFDGEFQCRATYSAMVNTLDSNIGELVQKLKDTNQFDDTLIIFTSDNGGCVKLEESGGNNFPLRGGKYSDLEGGVRTAAFVGGGYLQQKNVQGRTSEIVHIADWYATIASLAGVDDIKDYRAKASGLPELDSRDQTSLLFEGAPSKWSDEPLFLSSNAVIVNEHKLIVQNSVGPAGHPGQVYPNASSYLSPVDDAGLNLNCSTGCLFNVVDDPSEHNDLASHLPNVVNQLKGYLLEDLVTYENDDVLQLECDGDVGDEVNCGCHLAIEKWGGYLGPYAKGE